MVDVVLSPAEQAAKESLDRICACIDQGKSFLLEAGAGAGKTESLIRTLGYLIKKHGTVLLRQNQQVACITYTNVAVEEIRNRTDRHPAVHSSTIHAFCWSLIKNFQPSLRHELPSLNKWSQRLEESGGIGIRTVSYESGYRSVEEDNVSLHHNDVLALTVELMKQAKFRTIFTSRYPILLIDEYQDTDRLIAEALKTRFLDTGEGPLIGFFGDHWQKIYGAGCGKVEHSSLDVINQGANFRSVPVIVNCLNRMRPELPQQVKDPNAEGFVAVYHTNDWTGTRRTGPHWKGDLPTDVAHRYLEALREQLGTEGWDFAPDKTKVLMLTHRVLAMEQGYSNLAQVFPNNDTYIRKEDPHIAFFVDTLEPVCVAYQKKCFGEMFAALGGKTPAIQSPTDKANWARDMDALLELRSSDTIGAVLDHLRRTKRPHLPEAVERRERDLEQAEQPPSTEESSSITRLRTLRDISYQEVIALTRFIDGHTPFSTKHGVKGVEFENVLVVVGRGWNQYDFNWFLECAGTPDKIPPNRRDAFERNRNLFYVTTSRPMKRLAILFTQELTTKAMTTLVNWFGDTIIHSLQINN
ncbi:MAG: ATP-dependent helicase [Anaerolineales bacterium]|nr:MAG: ATP-dependent helicase [Anaerolineales bacterium]